MRRTAEPVSVFVVEDIKAATRGKKRWDQQFSPALARAEVGGATAPDNKRLVCVAPFVWHHRQLHRFQPEQGGKRKPYGGTLSQGIKRGTLITLLRWRTRLVPLTQAPASPPPHKERLLPPMPEAEGIRRRRFYEKDW